MLRPTLTLLHRSLRQDSRLLFSHLMRLALLGLVIWLLFIAHQHSIFFGAPGLMFFQNAAVLNFIFISIAAVSFFATAITEEKEEMTLGLLRMAGISPVALLAGKSTPRLINALLLLTVQFPFTWLAITLGGVTAHQVVATYCALLAYLLMAGNLALFCSVFCSTSPRASWMTGILLGLFLLSPAIGQFVLVDVMLYGGWGGDWMAAWSLSLVDWLESTSVFYRIWGILMTGFAEPVISFQVVSNLAAAIFFFVLSWATFGVFVRDDQPPEPFTLFRFKRGDGMARFGVGRAWPNALVWKDFHFLCGGFTWLVGKFLIFGILAAGLPLVIYGPWSGNMSRRNIGEMLVGWMLFLLAAEIALIASRIFREEVRNRTHAGLMLLPHSTAGIAYSKIAGCLLGLLPGLCYLYIGVTMAPEVMDDFFDLLGEPAFWWFLSMYVLFVHVTVLFSLLFKWGGLPLAFGAVFLSNAFCLTPFTFARPSDAEGVFVILAFMAIVGSGFLHFAIAERLRASAAE
ncbi:MAG: hypothetical protein WD648_07865 [Planctomycetaceae bacterium]